MKKLTTPPTPYPPPEEGLERHQFLVAVDSKTLLGAVYNSKTIHPLTEFLIKYTGSAFPLIEKVAESEEAHVWHYWVDVPIENREEFLLNHEKVRNGEGASF